MTDVKTHDAVDVQVPGGSATGSCGSDDSASSWGGASVLAEGPSAKEGAGEGVVAAGFASTGTRGVFVGSRAVVPSPAGGFLRSAVM